jgi:3-oxoadipate enol-lactonase
VSPVAETGHVRTNYTLAGAGPTVVLAHGLGGSRAFWNPLLPLLEGFRTLRYDLRAHGASSVPAGPYTIDDFVADALAVMDHAGVSSAHLIGFSLGGMIAQALAARHPARVRSVMLLNTVAGRTAEERERSRSRAAAIARDGAAASIAAAVDLWFTPAFRAARPDVVEARIEQTLATDPAGYAAAYRVFAETDLEDELDRISAPTLVATGADDPSCTPRMAALMQARIPNARLTIFSGLRHSTPLEAPDQVAAAWRRFVADDCAE